MKIFMIEPLGKGGIAHYTYNLLNSLSVMKEHTFMLFTSENYEFANQVQSFTCYPRMFRFAQLISKHFAFLEKQTIFPSTLRRCIKIIEYPFNALEALYLVKKQKVNCVHIQSVNLTELFMILMFRFTGVKIIYTIHNVNLLHKQMKFYHLFLLKLSYILTHNIIIHSKAGKFEIIDLFNISEDKITIIPHGNYDFFTHSNKLSKADAKRTLGIHNNTKTILFFGAIRPNKGLRYTILSLPLVKKSINAVKLLIVGEPYENYKNYSTLIQRHSLQDAIYEKLDYIPNEEVSLYFNASDLVVLPYQEITHSGVLQIAYAFGKPVVTTSLDGFRESVEDGKNGYLVEPNNPELLADKIIHVLADDNLMNAMGIRSRQLSETKYSWDAISRQTLALYTQCIETP